MLPLRMYDLLTQSSLVRCRTQTLHSLVLIIVWMLNLHLKYKAALDALMGKFCTFLTCIIIALKFLAAILAILDFRRFYHGLV